MTGVVDAADVIALLEDGPKRAAELAGWLELPPVVVQDALIALARAGVVEVHGRGTAARWALPSADRRVTEAVLPPPPAAPTEPLLPSRPPIAKIADDEFEVVWNGVGPLPGSGSAAGLGSTLSGGHFRVGKP